MDREIREFREFREFRGFREIRDYGDFSLTHTKRILILWWHSPDGFAYPRLLKYYPYRGSRDTMYYYVVAAPR